MSSIHIYWDESHFWGLLAARALEAWGIPHRLVRGSEIADGVLAGKCGEAPRLLIVPGGRAKGKADRLGVRGMDAICEFVHGGGAYLGFCGGAGLALTGPYGLGLSPWTRKGYTNRLHHFLSGHVHVSLNPSDPLVPPDMVTPDMRGQDATRGAANGPMLPVWWPGRFDPVDDSVTVLARYGRPGPDFWVADLNLSTLPQGTMADWENLYGIHLDPDFLEGTPCVAANNFGAGRVILSYAHLETPASPHANRWLAHILDHVLGGGHGQDRGPVPAWDVAARPVVWDDPALMAARRAMETTIATGTSHFLLFWRTPWLLGWRRGIPGAGINALYSLICEAMAHEPDNATLAHWRERAAGFSTLMGLLASGLSGYLLAERLSMTMFHSPSDAGSVHGLREQRRALFGLPPEPGGIYADLAATLEELCWRLSRPGQDRP